MRSEFTQPLYCTVPVDEPEDEEGDHATLSATEQTSSADGSAIGMPTILALQSLGILF